MKLPICEGQEFIYLPTTKQTNSYGFSGIIEQTLFRRQIWRIMKLTALLLLISFLQVSAYTYSQTLTINLKNASLEKLFAEIKKQSGYSFVYEKGLLLKSKSVNIDVTNISVENVLTYCFKEQPLTYTIIEKTVVVREKESLLLETETSGEKKENPPDPLEIIKGTITNAQGESLVGANVVIKRTGRGTQTNARGEFVLKNANTDDILVISYTGYKSKIIKVGKNSSLTLIMDVASDELDKVVVQAYGTTTQRLATGNIATVTAKQIERQPVANVLQALQGQVPGVVVQQTSGYASAPFKVEIRGRSVINPNLPSEPLYIVDGVPLTVLSLGDGDNYKNGSKGFQQGGINSPAGGQSPFFSINPLDIESLTVLKDADATAIYGSRGANGVIIVTTKKGRPGRTKFDLNVYQGISKVTQHYDLLNTQQYVMMRKEAFKNDGVIPDAGNAYDLLVWDTTRYTNWQKALFEGTGKVTNVDATLSGGDRLTTFRISADYRRQTSILNYSGADQRASVQFNLSHKSLNQKLNISFTSFYSYTQSDLIELGGSATMAPNAPAIFDGQGNLNFLGWAPFSDQYPFGMLRQPYVGKTGFLNSQLSLQYELMPGLTLSTNIGYSTNRLSQTAKQPISSQNPFSFPTGTSLFGNNNGTRSIIEPQLEYTRMIGKGKLNALIGGTLQSVSQDGSNTIGQGYTNDKLLGSIANAPAVYASDEFGKYKYAAMFGRINYNWENKYIINLSARRDGSSRFGPGKQYGNFGAIGAAWIFSEENWIKDHLSALSFGKLRSSYGLTGSDAIGDYNFLTQWSGLLIPYQEGTPAYLPLLHANPNLQWQTNKKLEVALNLGFFKDRFNVEISWYRNRCGNQLLSFPLSIITGFTSVTSNFPALVQNTGWELTLRAKLIEQKDLDLSFTLNAGRNYNKLVAYPNLSQSPYAYLYEIGQPLNQSRLLHYTGIDPLTGKYTFTDKNKDGQITTDPANNDYYRYEYNIKLDGGFGFDMRFKRTQLNLFFTTRIQPNVRSSAYSDIPGAAGINQSTQVLDRWQKPGDKAKFARFTTQADISDYNFIGSSDGVYSNGSYIRLRNISISYDLPTGLAKKAGLQAGKIYLRCENLFVLTKYNGIDPDGGNLGSLPPEKVATLGIQFNF